MNGYIAFWEHKISLQSIALSVRHSDKIVSTHIKRGQVMKKCLVLFIMIAALSISALSIASPVKRLDPGTQICRIFTQTSLWEGYEIFQNSCKNCHFTGNDKNASFIHSGSKSMKGWNRVFLKRYPQCAKKGEWDHLDEEQLMKLNDYLYRYASDSYDPYDANDCG